MKFSTVEIKQSNIAKKWEVLFYDMHNLISRQLTVIEPVVGYC